MSIVRHNIEFSIIIVIDYTVNIFFNIYSLRIFEYWIIEK
jgi:hypothetical protein